MSGARSSPNRRLRRILAAVAALLLVVVAVAERASSAGAAEHAIEGPWQGTLEIGAVELRIVFHFAKAADGTLTATLDSPDQGAKGIPFDVVTRDGDAIHVESRKIRGTYEGTLSADRRTIKGQWKQGGNTLPLELVRLDKEPEFRRPQDPQKPYPYREEEVTFENAAGGVKLAGTLTLPEAGGPVPAVLLISGSGAQDRNESILGHKPFLVLADYLTRRGIAVLRVDDRGIGGSTGDTSTSTTDDLTGDALAGVALLKRRKEIDPHRIGLLGHSEGAIIAPLAATRSADVAFIVLLAGTGVTGEEIVMRQGELIARAEKAVEKQIAQAREMQRQIFEIVRREPDATKAAQQIVEAAKQTESYQKAPTEKARAALEAQVAEQAKIMVTPWFRYFLAFDPTTALVKVQCPVLAINGEKDLQVDPQQNLPPIAAALKRAGNRDVTIRELPGLNHLFQHCQTGSPSEYGKISETISPEALAIIGDWIVARTK